MPSTALLRLLPLLSGLGLGATAYFASSTPASATTAPATLPPSTAAEWIAPTLSCLGQTFVLVQSTGTAEVETHEYLRTGESLREWTQLVTVQRLALPRPTSPADFVSFAHQRLTRTGGTTVLAQPCGPKAGLFTAHFPRTPEQEEQVVVCLVLAEPGADSRLQIIQYAARPTRLTPEVLELQLRAWRQRLLAQAQPRDAAG